MKKRKKNVIYCIAYMVLWVVFRIVMPTRCINKQNRPEGGALLCANHTRTNDPLFIAYALGWHYQIHVMAKEEIMHWPLHRLGAEARRHFRRQAGQGGRGGYQDGDEVPEGR